MEVFDKDLAKCFPQQLEVSVEVFDKYLAKCFPQQLEVSVEVFNKDPFQGEMGFVFMC